MSTLGIQPPFRDGITAPSLRDEAPRPVRPGGFLEISPAKAYQIECSC
jgi:hypothetical protein